MAFKFSRRDSISYLGCIEADPYKYMMMFSIEVYRPLQVSHIFHQSKLNMSAQFRQKKLGPKNRQQHMFFRLVNRFFRIVLMNVSRKSFALSRVSAQFVKIDGKIDSGSRND